MTLEGLQPFPPINSPASGGGAVVQVVWGPFPPFPFPKPHPNVRKGLWERPSSIPVHAFREWHCIRSPTFIMIRSPAISVIRLNRSIYQGDGTKLFTIVTLHNGFTTNHFVSKSDVIVYKSGPTGKTPSRCGSMRKLRVIKTKTVDNKSDQVVDAPIQNGVTSKM